MTNLTRRKLVILGSVAVCLLYLAYRTLYTLKLDTIYSGMVSVGLLICEAYGILVLLLFYFQSWHPYEPPEQPVLPDRKVDVFVPTYNEDISILRATLEACGRMTYPHRTYLCDDGGTDARCEHPENGPKARARRAELQALCAELGATYMTRPKNEHAKAGNLNHAFKQTDGEFIIIFDADHVPEPHFISRLIGYFADEKLGYIQTPHAFYNFDNFQAQLDHNKRVYWEEGQLFYHVIQPGRNYWDAPIFAGSAAMFRRKAMEEVGWIATETITEDMHTGMRINSRGYRSLAISERMVAGQAAPDVTTFHTQRLRWGEGNLSIMAYDNPLTMRGLTIGQRLCYFGSMVHWAGGLFKLGIYLTPILMLFTGVPPVAQLSHLNLGYLAVAFCYLTVTIAATRYASEGYGSFYNSEFFCMVNFWTQIRGTMRAIFWRKFQQFVVTSKRGRQSSSIWPFLRPQAMLIVLSFLALGWGWGRVAAGITNNYFEPVIPSAWVLFHVYLAYEVVRRGFWPKDGRFSFRHLVHLPIDYTPADAPAGTPARLGVSGDLNELGLSLLAYEPVAVGTRLLMTVRGGGEALEVSGTVRSSVRLDAGGPQGGGYRVGVQFDELHGLQTDSVNRICLHYAVPRMYDEYTASLKVTLGDQVRSVLGQTVKQKRMADRYQYRLPLTLRPEGVPGVVLHAVTEDISRDAFAVVLEEELPPGSDARFSMATPLGEVSGTVRILRNIPRRWAARDYHLCVLRFEQLDGEGRQTILAIVNPQQTGWLDPVLRPRRYRMTVPMFRLVPVAASLLLPLAILAGGLFAFVYRDDLFLAWALRQEKLTEDDTRRVQQIYDDTIRQRHPDMDRLVLLNLAMNKLGEGDKSDELAIRIARLDRTDLRSQAAAVDALNNSRRYAEAEAEYRRLVEQARGSLSPKTQRQLELAAARVAVHAGNYDAAVKRFRMLLDADPANPDLRYEFASVLVAAGSYPDAQKLYADTSPDTRARLLLATIDLLKGDYDKADAVVAAVLAADPTDAKARELQADIALARDKTAVARMLYERLAKGDAADPKLQAKLGQLALRSGAFEEALDRFSSMLASGTRTAEAERGFIDAASPLGERLTPAQREQARALGERALAGDANLSAGYQARLAWVLSQIGELDPSVQLLNRALAAAPAEEGDRVRQQLVGVLLKMKRWADAMMLLASAGKTAEAKQVEVSMFMSQNRYADAELTCRELLAMRKGDPAGERDAKRMLAEVLVLKEPHDFAGSLALFDELAAGESDPVRKRALQIRIAEITLWSGDYARAVGQYAGLLAGKDRDDRSLWPGFVDAASGAVGTHELTSAEVDLARHIYQATLGDRSVEPTMLSRLAWVMYRSGEAEATDVLLSAAVARVLADKEPGAKTLEARKELGGVLAAAGRVDAAIQMFEGADLKGLERLNLARVYLAAGRLREARRIVDELDREFPGERAVQLMKVTLLTSSDPKDFTAAAAILRGILSKSPDDREANLELGRLALDARQYDLALDCFSKLLATTPDQSELWVGFTDAAASAGKDRLDKIVKRTALAVADRALARKAGGFKSTEEEVTFLKRLGWVLYRLDAADRSVDAFRRALEIDPTDSAARVQLGETLQKLGRNTEAIAEFDKLKKPRKPKK